MAYLGFGINHQLACFLAWICVLGGGPIMFFQKLLGNFSVFSTFTIEESMKTTIWNLQCLRNSLETLSCFGEMLYRAKQFIVM
jgi:hypothetical protein